MKLFAKSSPVWERLKSLESRMDDLESSWVSQRQAIKSLLGRLYQKERKAREGKDGEVVEEEEPATPEDIDTAIMRHALKRGIFHV